MDILKLAGQALERAGLETRFAATLLQARGAGVAMTPPHKLLRVARDVEAYGPAGAAVSLAAASFGGRAAIRDEIGDISFAELDEQSNALANALHTQGVEPRDGFGIMCRNHRGLWLALFAGAKLGAKTLLLNTDFAGPQLKDVCEREGVKALIHDEEFADVANDVDLPGGKYVAWHDGDTTDDTLLGLIRAGDPGRPPRPSAKQKIVLLTSGTTGTPKGAPRDMGLSLALPGGYLSRIPLRAGRTVVLSAPGFHAWGLLSSMLALGLGNTVVTARKTDPAFTLRALEENAADTLVTVPILLSRLLEEGEDELAGRDLAALRVIAVSGSALPAELATRTMDLLGDIVYNLYGSTEVAYAAIATPADLRAAPGTVGRPPTGTSITLLDDDDHEVAPGESGRIFVGSSMQFEGYTGGGTKDVVAGKMSTGDIGHFDDDGRLFVDGRDDDMIVSGGENVFPAEVEELLATYDGVAEAAVLGVDDEKYGKRLRGYVVLDAGADVDEQTLKDHVKSNLARYKVPREIVFIDEMPRNPAGKVVKRDLPDPD
ncbi:fatty-acyl-CoA synthase [Jatrophihabitans endophyticus]|uniref:Fatty-acyl-CoA synthase n=2 Tax=Jatrophihabitans endophyticus TaxID=1206085 RepID=A0A1M5I2P4_9ACTN|nr:fatty-acyl-CoA synthase [Jatrophihabitans endophyticus]